MTDVVVPLGGWGRFGWGEMPWGQTDLPKATGNVGSVTVVAEANAPVTGLAATGNVGSVTVQADANIGVTGVSATGVVGTVTTASDAIVNVTGVSAEAITPTGGGPAFTADGTAQLSTAQAKFGPSSLLLDGTDDFVTSDNNIDLSSGDFTVDMWIRPTSVTGYKGLWQSGTSSLLNVYLIGNQVQGTVAGSTTLFLSSTRISANVWTMISVEREGNVHRLYINGVLEQSSSTGNRPDDGVFAIGKNGFGDFNGYIDELRLSSVARYGGTSFTEPTANYAVDGDTNSLLHFDGINGSTDITNETDRGVIVIGEANVFPTGLEANGEVDTVSVDGDANVPVVGLEATGGVGSVSARIDQNINVEGVSATARVGSVTVNAGAIVNVTGVSATTEIGTVLVYGRIVPNQNSGYSEEIPSQNPGYSEEIPSQSPGYSEEIPSQSPTWSEESPAQNANWTRVAA